jgi:hypothetical protein
VKPAVGGRAGKLPRRAPTAVEREVSVFSERSGLGHRSEPARAGARRPHRRPLWAVVPLALAALLVLVACDPPEDRADADDPRRSITVALAPTPPAVGPAVVEVQPLLDDAPIEGASVQVVGDMTHAGMAPVQAEALRDEDGTYRTEDFAFTMAGDWVLSVDVTYPDGTVRSTAVNVSVER